jgi:hypothetical protein
VRTPAPLAEPPFWPWPEELTNFLTAIGCILPVLLLAGGIALIVVVRRR